LSEVNLDGVSTKSSPSLNGVVRPKIAILPDFACSRPLRSMGGTWSPARLDAFLRNAQALAPGTDMWWEADEPTTRRAIIE
jgi:cytochrome c